MAINVDILNVSNAKLNGNDILSGTRVISQLVSDNKVVLDSSNFTGIDDINTVTNIDSDIQLGTVMFYITISEIQESYDYTKFLTVNGLSLTFVERNGQVFTFKKDNININAFSIENYNVYTITNLNVVTKVGVAQINNFLVSTFPYSFETVLDNVPWSMADITSTIDFDSSFTELNLPSLDGNILQTSTLLKKGDFISIDKEVFTYVNYINETGDYVLYDVSEINDGITEVEMSERDYKKVNFIKDYRDGLYDYGLKSALIENMVGSIIYGSLNDEIIVDANEGGKFIVGSMYTIGEDSDTGATDKFQVHISDDGENWTMIYENLERRTYNKTHVMTGEGRFIKIVFMEESTGWSRIHTNLVNGRFWDLSIVHPESKLYKFNASLEINGQICRPNNIEYFDNMQTNKLHFDRLYVDSYQLELKSNMLLSLDMDLWYEVEGLI